MDTPLHAEIHNSSLYVHPPLFMNQFSLKAVFEGTKVPVYVYKLFPEGSNHNDLNTRNAINVARNDDDIKIKGTFGQSSKVDGELPIRYETMREVDIENFENLPAIHQSIYFMCDIQQF